MLPLMLREVLHYSNGRISLVALARPLFYGLAGPVAGYYAVRIGERRTAISDNPAREPGIRRGRLGLLKSS